jgi:hypothetical protein
MCGDGKHLQYSQNHVVTDMCTTEQREKEGRNREGWQSSVQSGRIGLVLPIDANPYNQNPPMQEHSQCIRDSAASLSIHC